MASYLQRCLELFSETVEARFGWRPDYAGLEAALEPVRRGDRGFCYADLETIQNGRYWDFRQFWRFPPESDLRQELDLPRMATLLSRLPLDEEESLRRLHAAFKSIENLSVVLRFIHPDRYGIMSPPVEKILEVRRGRTEVETYLNYLRDIRELKDHHGLRRAADADMALWVLQERVLGSYRDHDLLAEFRADAWLQRRRAVNLLAGLRDLAGDEDHLDLARALVSVHAGLAGLLAGCAFERRLAAMMEDRLRLETLLEQAVRQGAVSAEAGSVREWLAASRIRDRIVLGDCGDPPKRRDVMELIEQAERLGRR